MIDDFSQPSAPKPSKPENSNPAASRPDFSRTQPSYRNPFVHGDAERTPEPAFRTPEQIQAAETPPVNKVSNTRIDAHLALPAHTKRTPKEKLQTILAWRPTKKQAIIIAVVMIVATGLGGTAFAMTHHSKPAPATKAVVKTAPKPVPPKPITSPLTGLIVTAEQQGRPVTGVMIENSPDARPQSGLDQAGVIFEAIAEAGITRFLALYQDNTPQVLGPVRSSRPYYLDWAMAFDAGYAHVGGSPDALQRIKDIGVKDLDQFYNSAAYHRISTRYAPHNMYTSLDSLLSLENSKGWSKSNFTPLPRKAKEQPLATPTAKSISFGISGAFYNVHYDYDAAKNDYLRSEGGSAHIDNETKQQLSPKVVIALAMPYSLMDDGYHSMYQTQGSGKMLLFQDGGVTTGTWTKGDPKSQFVFKDDSGKPMELDPGQTWITALGDISAATYQP